MSNKPERKIQKPTAALSKHERYTKQNKTKQNKTKQNKTKQNKTKQNKTKQKACVALQPLLRTWAAWFFPERCWVFQVSFIKLLIAVF